MSESIDEKSGKKIAFEEGFEAGRFGASLKDCPYEKSEGNYAFIEAWNKGWFKGREAS